MSRAVFKSRAPKWKPPAEPGASVTLADLAELQRQGLVKVTGRGKYGSKRCVVQGEAFDSKSEAKRWLELKDMERRGLITGLLRQVEYRLEIRGILITRYYADFVYRTINGREIVEDVKSKATITPAYIIKRKLMKVLLNIDIREHMV